MTAPRRTHPATVSSIQAAGRADWITYDGRTKRRAEWADELNIKRKTLTARMARGATFEEAIAMETQAHATPDEADERRAALYAITEEMQPMTVRAVYYQAVVKEIVPKGKGSYKMVAHDLGMMRKGDVLIDGKRMPYKWIVDNVRSLITPFGYDSVAEALEETADNFRVNLWKDAKCRVIVFLEADSLTGVIKQTTLSCGVDLAPVRGYSSLSFLDEIATKYADFDGPVHCLLLGDYDPSGLNLHSVIERTVTEMATDINPDADFRWSRIGLTEKQIDKWKLKYLAVNGDDSRSSDFTGKGTVELDAVEPKKLRKLVKDAIDKYMDDDERAALRADEADQREYIRQLAYEAAND